MPDCWLANANPKTAWAHYAWTEFAEARDKGTVAVLPVHGFSDQGEGMPLDMEETLGSEMLRSATRSFTSDHPRLRLLPPLRWTLAAKGTGVFGIDPETAYQQLMSLARGVKESGVGKLVFFNTSLVSEPLLATVAIDARAEHGLRTYVIHARNLGIDLYKKPETATNEPPPALLQTSAQRLAELLLEIHHHPAPVPPQNPGLQPLPPPRPSAFPFSRFSSFPLHRNRRLAALSRSQLLGLDGKAEAWVILPTASIEQHGHHLPVGVDAILGEALLDAMLTELSPLEELYVAPSILFGKSNEHAGFPGTLSLAACTLRRILLAAAAQLERLGFRRIAILNTHGGNTAVLQTVVREMKEDLGLDALLLRHGYEPPGLSAQEAAWGMHADEWETSLMLACAPELVDMDKAVCEYPAQLDAPGLLRPEKAPATFAWLTSDVSKSGVLGDPRGATPEKGHAWLAAAGEALRAKLQEENRRRIEGRQERLRLG
jgi:creatinine amidohydrolase